MIYVILGQTASGKTSLCLNLARKLNLPIISADAYQCYQMMQIGTDKPTREETEGLSYYFYDEYEPDSEVDVSLFQKTMRPILENYLNQGKDVIVVGGTFLYIKALLFNYVFTEKENRESIYRTMGLEELQAELSRQNPKIYNEIDNKNPRRLIRALEQIQEGKDRDKILEENDNRPLYPVTFLRIDIDKEEGNRKIDDRIEKMFNEGIVDEVRRLMEKYPLTSHSLQAIGYKEIIQCLQEGKSEEEMKELIKIHTHQYAKKQRTFLNHQFENVYHSNKEDIAKLIEYDILRKVRTRAILKPEVTNAIEKASVYFIGLGGVGSGALLPLVRLGIHDFTIQDGDTVDVSNLNRQSLYEYKDIQKSKTEISEKRIKELNPLVTVCQIDKRIEDDKDMPKRTFDYIIDCIDDVDAKCMLYEKAKKDHSIYLTSMGMGFHYDTTKIRLGTLKEAFDPLSKSFRKALLEHGHPDEEIDRILCVYASDQRLKGKKDSKLIGSLSNVPNAAGLALVTYLIRLIMEEKKEH